MQRPSPLFAVRATTHARLCADVSLQKLPILHGLAARAPYFHNGSATSLTQVVNFYNARFKMGLNPTQKTDLVNFLNAL